MNPYHHSGSVTNLVARPCILVAELADEPLKVDIARRARCLVGPLFREALALVVLSTLAPRLALLPDALNRKERWISHSRSTSHPNRRRRSSARRWRLARRRHRQTAAKVRRADPNAVRKGRSAVEPHGG